MKPEDTTVLQNILGEDSSGVKTPAEKAAATKAANAKAAEEKAAFDKAVTEAVAEAMAKYEAVTDEDVTGLQGILGEDRVEVEGAGADLPGMYEAITDSSGFQGKTYWEEGEIAYVTQENIDHHIDGPALIHFRWIGPLPHQPVVKPVYDPEVHLAQATFAEAEATKTKTGINAPAGAKGEPPRQSKITPPKK